MVGRRSNGAIIAAQVAVVPEVQDMALALVQYIVQVGTAVVAVVETG
jgi:hypothetical protein